jgi:hypothetical protein
MITHLIATNFVENTEGLDKTMYAPQERRALKCNSFNITCDWNSH